MSPAEGEGAAETVDRILVDQKAAKNVPAAVLERCARIALKRRLKIPVNPQWQEGPVTDIDGQSVIMVLSIRSDEQGRRLLIVNRARYKPKGGGRR
jgi:hypothetical protein